jgi:heptosyltransferase II
VPEVDEVISLTGRSLFGAVRLIRQQPRFDVAILFPNSLRAALEAWLVGVPRRIGYPGHHRRWLLNQIIGEPTRDEKKKKKKRKKKRSLIGPPVDRYSQIARELAQ